MPLSHRLSIFVPWHHVLIFEVFVALTLMATIFWRLILFSLEVTHQHIRGTFCLHLEGQRISHTEQNGTEQNIGSTASEMWGNFCQITIISYIRRELFSLVLFTVTNVFFIKETCCFYLKGWIWRQSVLIF